MKQRILLLVGIAMLLSIGCGEGGSKGKKGKPTSADEIKAAKEAFAKCKAASDAGKEDEIEKYVEKQWVAKLKGGMGLKFGVSSILGRDIEKLKALHQGNIIEFQHISESKGPGGATATMTQTLFRMIKEDGQWKLKER
jgi:hypothetical protein